MPVGILFGIHGYHHKWILRLISWEAHEAIRGEGDLKNPRVYWRKRWKQTLVDYKTVFLDIYEGIYGSILEKKS